MVQYKNPPNQSKGILDDFAVRKNVATREGTIEKVPVNDSDIVNKKYVDDSISSGDHGELTNVTASQHHTKYTDTDAVAAVSDDDAYLKNTGDTGAGDYEFDGAITINESGADKDFRIEGVGEANALFIRGSDGFMGIGTNNPQVPIHFKTSAAAPIFRTEFAEEISTSASSTVFELLHTTSLDMIDGFGARFKFRIQDNADVINTISWIQSDRDGADNSGNMSFWTRNAGSDSEKMKIKPNGYVGIGITPTAPFHVKHSSDNLIAHFESGDNAARILINDDDTNTYVQALDNISSIGGTLGNNALNINILNTGEVGIGTAAPTTQFSVKEKSGMTPIGGFAIKLTNKTGGNTVAGQLIAVYSATAVNDAFKTALANSDEVIGIVLEAGVSDGSETWVVVSGIADVLMDAGGSARGDRIISSATAGSADVWNVGGAVATHFQEIGHCTETRTGAGLARCVLHFN